MCNNIERQIAINQAKQLFKEYQSFSRIAEELDVNPAHVWNAVRKDYASPALVKALRIKETRTRICAEVSKEQREALHALATSHGLTWSEYCRQLAESSTA